MFEEEFVCENCAHYKDYQVVNGNKVKMCELENCEFKQKSDGGGGNND